MGRARRGRGRHGRCGLTTLESPNPFDAALALEQLEDGLLEGVAPQAYWNMVGPFGGITAAILLAGVLRQPQVLGDPLALTVNYTAPVRAGRFLLRVVLARSNRATQHWRIDMLQPEPHGDPGRDSFDVVAHALAVCGVRRDVWSAPAAPVPEMPDPDSLVRHTPPRGLPWFERYDRRMLKHPFRGQAPDAPVRFLIRDDPPRPLDFPALAALCDTFFPGIFARRRQVVPVATVTMNSYFHATAADLSAIGTDYLLGVGTSNVYEGGFFDAESRLWAQGRLIATTHQLMWYRE